MSEKSAKNTKGKIKLTVISVVVFVLVIVAGIFAFGFQRSTVIANGVHVNSIPVGGLSQEEAAEKISQTVTEDYFDKNVVIKYKDKAYDLNLNGVVTVNVEETVKVAYEKSGNWVSKIFNKGKIVVPFCIETDAESVKSQITEYFKENENITEMFSFNEDFTLVSVDTSKLDKAIDVEGTLNIVFENIKNDVYDSVDALVLEENDADFAESIYQNLVRPPVNATVGLNEDNTTYIIPEIIGIEADKEEFLKLYKENNGKFQMAVKPVQPEITTKDLKIDFYQDVLGSYTSSYNEGLVNRTKNVKLAAKHVNGTVIMPGKNFSYNEVVGPRTYARGFVDATVFTGEGTEEGVGGGICQVSSTIYCAQLRANLKTVSRTNHSYTIVYVPLGQDATVVYGSLDYVFKNDTNYPIKIQAYASGGKLTVKILGTKTDKSLSYDIVSVTNSTIAKGEVRKETSDLPEGETKVKQNGQNGAVVSTYKIYYKNGVEQKREYIGKSTYKAMNRIVLVGTKPNTQVTDDKVPDGTSDMKDTNVLDPDKPVNDNSNPVPDAVNNSIENNGNNGEDLAGNTVTDIPADNSVVPENDIKEPTGSVDVPAGDGNLSSDKTVSGDGADSPGTETVNPVITPDTNTTDAPVTNTDVVADTPAETPVTGENNISDTVSMDLSDTGL